MEYCNAEGVGRPTVTVTVSVLVLMVVELLRVG